MTRVSLSRLPGDRVLVVDGDPERTLTTWPSSRRS